MIIIKMINKQNLVLLFKYQDIIEHSANVSFKRPLSIFNVNLMWIKGTESSKEISL